MNSQFRSLLLFTLLLNAGCVGRPAAASTSALVPNPADTTWLAREPAICDELRGRVFDATTGAPLREAYVAIEGAPHGTGTDSLGRFRLPLSKQGIPRLGDRRSIPVRIRHIGNFDLRFELPAAPGYVVEVFLGRYSVAFESTEWHPPAVTSLRIKDQGSCVRAA